MKMEIELLKLRAKTNEEKVKTIDEELNEEEVIKLIDDNNTETLTALWNEECEKEDAILTSELNMWHVSAKFVPHLLTTEQKVHSVEDCQDLCQRASDDPSFMLKISTSDESWVYGYDPEMKQQLTQWKSLSSP
ncbi:uncharacterized protein LOC115221204 [Octopus sinensis]|uniref:Uncharacterized protein LOC115221204 n=1 Tax=Octopus sinensis TaxID=2607531 RepID=A0A6P7TA51_9MOLL|nr:uncharacterized protein LOC115221204 [Octopus sinensis]